jgi:ABC-type glycerol-3-phosphate transport system substrate-binding protein
VVYRADRLADPKVIAAFRQKTGQTPAAPASWEDFAVLATFFAEFDHKPSLPPMTAAETADLFFRVAACYDRPAKTESLAKGGGGVPQVSFQHDVATAQPRLDSPPFRAAADWLGSLPRPSGVAANPAEALAKGEASLAVLSLAQLAELPRENGRVPARFGIAPLPGTRKYFDQERKQFVLTTTPNYVPYFSGGRLGVVRSRCSHPEAAFDLLAELAGPTRSLELLSTPGLGVGPFRDSHLDRERLSAWYGFGFEAERTKQLQDTMRQYLRPEIRNPVYGLRGPDEKELNAAAAEELSKIATGKATPEAGLKGLLEAWTRVDAKTPRETLIRWRKLASGLN